jgi:hypothetical protein
MLLGKWPVLMLRIRLGRTFNSDLLDMVWSHQLVLWFYLLFMFIKFYKYYVCCILLRVLCLKLGLPCNKPYKTMNC